MFYYYPIIWGVGLSFFDYVPKEHAVFVGLDNIVSVIKNTAFWQSSLNMLWLLVTDILKALIPPFIFAECIIAVRSKKYSYWTRVLLFIPGILPGVASTLVWAEGIFGSGSSGLLNSALSALVPSFVNQSWLYQESTALGSIICFGFPWVGSYLLLYGAITGISPSLYEAAKLDGCTWLKRITHIDLPLILPQLKYIFITSFIASVQDYGRIYITTQGDYGTSTPALAMYLAITKEKNYGIASAMSLFLFAFLIVVTVINFRMQSDTSEEKTL
jgi:ABC-type sugar transport system permease subunit